MENTKENCEMIWKISKKSKLKSEQIWKIWKKGKLNSEMICKIWKKLHQFTYNQNSIKYIIIKYLFRI
jgi:hypothetical protein